MKDSKLENFIVQKFSGKDTLAEVFLSLAKKHKGENMRQHTIRAMIELYERKHPEALEEASKQIQKRRETAKNEFSSVEDQDQRLLFSFPAPLYHRLSMIVKDPPFLSNEAIEHLKEDEWVAKEFKRYLVPNKF